MINQLFILSLLLFFSLVLAWGFRVLPREGWQMLATLPIRPLGNGQWQGINLTWYGLLTANAYLLGILMLIVLLGAAHVPLTGVLLLVVCLLLLCVPASRWIARIIEGKAHTFTVGGAVFIGILAAPWMVKLVNFCTGDHLPVLTTLAAISIAYAFGEGLGRLACISFGCCYGKPVSQCRPLLRELFSRWHFIFHGETRKICYASDLEGEPVVPVQALTAILYLLIGLLGIEFYLYGHFAAAFASVLLITQLWRFFSEFLRADFRGNNKFSAYQIMGLLVIPYALLCAYFFNSAPTTHPDLLQGLQNLWQPATLLFLQIVWLVLFAYTGRSTVTGAQLSFHIHRDRI
ncbi:Prolipoprotein diacylglyceryl transferase [Desulfuromusa kysingii]|uniref:Prolipoprotein diacylglyceryl transferase n=1 Tax=Desulfuromusa kysingii TaxID=37625 RepID=A0A1H3ZSW7_9BACT|nr:prolipoprotein diacylglyceryl transferase family protein [Desulfuromusa kysingii]SEA26856.1 Prolipoprotein diacylglyceryl transferase [Desulfuromusa kysingii]